MYIYICTIYIYIYTLYIYVLCIHSIIYTCSDGHEMPSWRPDSPSGEKIVKAGLLLFFFLARNMWRFGWKTR